MLKRVLRLYEPPSGWALRHSWLTLLACGLILVAGGFHLPATGDAIFCRILTRAVL